MEWVETTAKSVEEATEDALEQLGVDESDAEIEVLEEPRPGLFGRTRGEARIRARVRPRAQRPKQERRDRGRRPRAGDRSSGGERVAGNGRTDGAPRSGDGDRSRGGSSERGPRPARTERAGDRSATPAAPVLGPDGKPLEPLGLEGQAELATEFLDGLLAAFGLTGAVSTHPVDDDTVELRVEGDDLGLLIGPAGRTLNALQELTRTAVHRRAPQGQRGWIRLDVAGYRERRRAALEQFAVRVAEEVRTTGKAKALEPMVAADRKVVHDAMNGIDGVTTSSEGEDPRRYIVVRPAADASD